ncbi:hypothetical protein [Microcystis phage Mwe-JY08]
MPRTAKDFLEAYRRNLEDGLARSPDDGYRTSYLHLAIEKHDRMRAAFNRWVRNDKRTGEFPGDLTVFHIEAIGADLERRLDAIRATARRRIAISEGALSQGPVTGAWALAGVAIFGAAIMHASPAAAAVEAVDVLSSYNFWAAAAIIFIAVALGSLALANGLSKAAARGDELDEPTQRDAYVDELASKYRRR